MTSSIRADAKHRNPTAATLLAFALCGLALACVSARAATLDPVTISAPAAKVVGRDTLTNSPLERIRITANVEFNPVTLTTNSGVALLQDSVRTAAYRACAAVDPLSLNEACVIRAELSAQPQVDAAIARARGETKG